MFLYKLFNLVIDSDEVLPELVPNDKAGVDIYVRHASPLEIFPTPLSWFMQWHLPGGELWLSCAKMDGGYLLRFNELTDFFVSDKGKQIAYLPKPEIPPETIHHLLLDQVIPLVINLRGGEALHVSAVLTSHGVAAFAGPTGSGKSTLAGVLFNIGYPIVSDDCLVLMEKNKGIYAIPAYPGLRLWGDALSCLFGDNGPHKSVAHYTEKRRVDIKNKKSIYSAEPQPFRRLYAIADQPESKEKNDIAIERLPSRESFIALVQCAFRLDITDHSMLKQQFHFLEKVVCKVSVRRLIFPKDLNVLPAVREAIVTDLKDLDN